MYLLGRWERMIESEAGLVLARVSKFYSVLPSQRLGIEDSVEAMAVDEALMLRYQVWEYNENEKQKAAQEREQKMQGSLDSPGSQQKVAPPSIDELRAMAEAS